MPRQSSLPLAPIVRLVWHRVSFKCFKSKPPSQTGGASPSCVRDGVIERATRSHLLGRYQAAQPANAPTCCCFLYRFCGELPCPTKEPLPRQGGKEGPAHCGVTLFPDQTSPGQPSQAPSIDLCSETQHQTEQQPATSISSHLVSSGPWLPHLRCNAAHLQSDSLVIASTGPATQLT